MRRYETTKCGTCTSCHKTPDNPNLTCHFTPPQPMSGFPIVQENDWCAQYEMEAQQNTLTELGGLQYAPSISQPMSQSGIIPEYHNIEVPQEPLATFDGRRYILPVPQRVPAPMFQPETPAEYQLPIPDAWANQTSPPLNPPGNA